MRRVVWLAVGAVLLGGAAAGHADSAVQRNCAWQTELAPDQLNALYPDTGARYWNTVLPAVPGERLTITGYYPHARYISYNTYDGALQSTDGLDDQRIRPDRGSTNPFLPGANRRADRRSYTLTVVFGPRPAHPPANTIYTTSTDGAHAAHTFTVIYRVYRPDRGRDAAGGVALPTVTVRLPGGAGFVLPDCPWGAAPSQRPVNQVVNGASPTWPRLAPTSGLNPPVWYKFFNAAQGGAHVIVENGLFGTRVSDRLVPYAMRLPSGGFANNADNAYIFAVTNVYYGTVLVIHGRLPSFVHTYQGQPVMGSGQVRYWSMCSYDPRSQRVYDCLLDDQLRTDRAGYYTIVVTASADRPARLVATCGWNWLDAGPTESTLLITRNMLASPTFRQSVQAARYGREAHDMGAYYPRARYVTNLGC